MYQKILITNQFHNKTTSHGNLTNLCLFQIDQGWWYGFSSGHYGLFPANYVELIDSSEIVQH